MKGENMIYLLRHGLDDERFIGGWSNVHLTTTGIKQVRDTIEFMKTHRITFKRIYSSDILRAKETARLVSNAYGIPIKWESRLRELDKGLMTGLHKRQAERKFKEYNKTLSIEERYPEGESLLDLYKRQKEVLEWILSMDETLIVTHRGPINMYYNYITGQEPTTDKTQFGVTHASLHELDPKQKVMKKIYDPKEKEYE